ncbi:MAG: radical SAM family heme chaperone HemW [Bacteroidales bacterium]|nr:radical SAM family heme chaperone HemW [Bacteroidales bacterium]
MIYVHIPFCRSFCTYCDFYSEVAAKCRKAEDAIKQESLFGAFAEALAKETVSRADEISDEVNTLYIGGGTPSVLPLSAFNSLLEALRSVGHSGQFDEFTVEVNPEDVVEKGPGYIEGLMKLGVNRISMGVQSFDNEILRFMNRRHDADTAVSAYAILEQAGVKNISIDLIFGLPQLSSQRWRETVDKALHISSQGNLPGHISSYQLSVEPGSMLAKLVERGQWSEAEDGLCHEQYSILCEMLSTAGYHHYEISNFALPGYEAKHNSAYWRHVPYVGLGPGAHSMLIIPQSPSATAPEGIGALSDFPCLSGQTPVPVAASGEALRIIPQSPSATAFKRMWNREDLTAYIQDPMSVQDGEDLTAEQVVLEKIMLGLRTSDGVAENYLRANCDVAELAKALREGNLEPVTVAGHCNLRIPENRFFVSDAIISALV